MKPSISRVWRVLHFLHLLLQALIKPAFIKEPLQTVEVVKPSISRVWRVLHFLHLLLQALIKASL